MNNTKKLSVVLVIDDEPIILETFKVIFQGHFKVLTAQNGKEALERIANNSIKLIFLDINIPGTTGIEILRRIKKYDENLPVIIVTAIENQDTVIEANQLKIHSYISKPFDVNEVIALAHKAVKNDKLIRLGANKN